MTVDHLLVKSSALLCSFSDAQYAAKMADYMKGHFSFYGVRGPERKLLLVDIKQVAKAIDIEELLSFAKVAYKKDEREYQYVAIDLLKWRRKKLQAEHLPALENLIITKSWWDSVDAIAANLIGEVLADDKDLQYKTCERWIESENLWLRRSAIIHQLRYKSNVDQDLLFALIESQTGSNEFFINKACGWALRQYSKSNSQAVASFIDLHPTLSGLTVREASKYL